MESDSNMEMNVYVPISEEQLSKDFENCMKSVQEFRASPNFGSGRENANILLKNLSELFEKFIPTNYLVTLGLLLYFTINEIQMAVQENNQLIDITRPPNCLFQILVKLHEKIVTVKDLGVETRFNNLITSLVRREGLCAASFKLIPFLLWKPEKIYGNSYPELLAFSEFNETNLSNQVDKSMVINTLRHATSTTDFLKMLNYSSDSLYIKSNTENTKDLMSNVGLVYCGFDVPNNILDDVILIDTRYEKAKQFLCQNRYGAVVIKFPTSSMTRKRNHVFEFRTKKYWFEYSSVLLTIQDTYDDKIVFLDNETNEVAELTKVDFKENEYKCSLKYSTNGDWTHPEVAFVGDLPIPVRDCSIEFVTHKCIDKYLEKCTDREGNQCLNKQQAMEKFARGLKKESQELLNRFKQTADLEEIKKILISLDATKSVPPEAKIPKL